MDIPPLTSVQKIIEINQSEGYAIVQRKLEDGYEVVRSSLPCLFTVEKEISQLSYSPFPNMIKAARYQPVIWSVNDLKDVERSLLGLKGSPTIVSKVWPPERPKGGEILTGSAQEQVEQIVNLAGHRYGETIIAGFKTSFWRQYHGYHTM